MPGYKAHISFSILWYTGTLLILYKMYTLSMQLILELAVCTIFGSLFPDIDIKSKGQKYFYTIFFIIAALLLCMKYFFIVAITAWLLFIPMMVKHRGIFHDPLIMNILLAIVWLIWYANYPFVARHFLLHFICFTIGMYSHIMLDYGIVHCFKKLNKTRKRTVFKR